jgi:hypothetical protein
MKPPSPKVKLTLLASAPAARERSGADTEGMTSMQAQPSDYDGPLVYFIQSTNGGPVKIGYVSSAGCLQSRVAALQTGSPYPLKVLRAIPGDRIVEAELHARFAGCRVSGEWFLPAPELSAYLTGAICNRREPRAIERMVRQAYDRGVKDGHAAGLREGYLETGERLREALSTLPLDPEDWDSIGSNPGAASSEAA